MESRMRSKKLIVMKLKLKAARAAYLTSSSSSISGLTKTPMILNDHHFLSWR